MVLVFWLLQLAAGMLTKEIRHKINYLGNLQENVEVVVSNLDEPQTCFEWQGLQNWQVLYSNVTFNYYVLNQTYSSLSPKWSKGLSRLFVLLSNSHPKCSPFLLDFYHSQTQLCKPNWKSTQEGLVVLANPESSISKFAIHDIFARYLLLRNFNKSYGTYLDVLTQFKQNLNVLLV